MFGVRYIKFDPTQYVIQYKAGKVVREGAGLSFFYFAPSVSLVALPLQTSDAPFMFEETTSDFQEITIQGQVTYRIKEPQKTAALINHTLDSTGQAYATQDPEKLQLRIMNAVQVLTHSRVEKMPLRKTLAASAELGESIIAELAGLPEIVSLGVEVLGISILAIKPNPETARALEAEAREQLLKEADDAIYIRRNASVEHERSIKENELRTEKAIQEKRNELEAEQTAHEIAIENKRKELVVQAAENSRTESEAKAFAVEALVKAMQAADPAVVQAMVAGGIKPDRLIANAFSELAKNSEKIGNLNISPDLLSELIQDRN
ncbi:MAG: SPFH domain-containing protein [Verrucomicrobiae bacterium]|nr:SPFH domain-containing protein [Verrucomicrobiae bacterium]